MIGFSITASFAVLQSKKFPVPSYIFFYPAFLFVNSMLVYGLFNMSNRPGVAFFYPLTAWLCLNLGFWIDRINFYSVFDSIAKGLSALAAKLGH